MKYTTDISMEYIEENQHNGIKGFFDGISKTEKIENMQQYNRHMIISFIRSPAMLNFICSELNKQGFKVLRIFKNSENK